MKLCHTIEMDHTVERDHTIDVDHTVKPDHIVKMHHTSKLDLSVLDGFSFLVESFDFSLLFHCF